MVCCNLHIMQAHPFWDSGTGVEMAAPTPDVIVPTEAEVNSAVQVREDLCRYTLYWV